MARKLTTTQWLLLASTGVAAAGVIMAYLNLRSRVYTAGTTGEAGPTGKEAGTTPTQGTYGSEVQFLQ